VVLDDQLLDDPEQAAISNSSSVTKRMKWSIQTDTMRLGGAIATQYGNSGFVGQINPTSLAVWGRACLQPPGMLKLKVKLMTTWARDAWW